MDCPNCGAYNATNSIRCRRCDQLLPTEDAAERDEQSTEWGPASGPSESWEEHFRQPPASEPDEATEREDSNSWSESQWSGQSEWPGSDETRSSPTSSDPLPSQSSSGMDVRVGDVPNYLWPSIGATICCCAPLGIPAIVFASRVDPFLAAGDRAAAEEASNKAKMWSLAAAAVAAMFWIAIFCTGQFGGGTGV
jgi:hypothetical protein